MWLRYRYFMPIEDYFRGWGVEQGWVGMAKEIK
jgi:hypothetical protein